MSAITNFLIDIYAFSAAVPFVWFFALWIGVYYWRKDSKRATTLAMDVTTLLLIGSVSAMYYNLLGSWFGFFIILLFFLIGYGLLGNFQYRIRGKIDHARIFRLLWRIGFLGLSAFYLLFLFIGLGKSIFSV